MILSEQIIEDFQKKSRISKTYIRDYIERSSNDALVFASELIHDGYLDKDSAGSILGNSINTAYINLNTTLFHDKILERLPREIALECEAIPIYKLGHTVTVAMSEPNNYEKIKIISGFLNEPIDAIFSLPEDILTAIKLRYQHTSDIQVLLQKINLSSLHKLQDQQLADLNPVVEASKTILLLAIKENASDIHIEAREHEYLIRFRVDGELKEVMRLPSKVGLSLVSRYKVISKLDIAEKRKPQDGKFSVPLPNSKFDIRVSTLPALYGEKAVLRILGGAASGSLLHLNNLHLRSDIYDNFSDALSQPEGIIFVTGPTGSGKSTSLYSGLHHINREGINITTIEDPVEYTIPSITQTQVDNKAGRTFSTILRSCLRQDPDVLLVGEIRDKETAKIASEAALTGHLVLSTLHTNNALQAIIRLIEIGVEAHIVAPAIVGVLAQRLVRKICDKCKEPYVPDEELLHKYFYWKDGLEKPSFYRGRGCEHCGNTGFSGRIGIHEFVRVNARLRDLIVSGAKYDELLKESENQGFKNMRYDGFIKALKGITTIEEVVHATPTG